MNLKDEIENYIDDLTLKDITKESYKQILNRFYEYFKNKNINEPTRKDIIKYREYLFKSELSSATIQKIIVVLRGFYRYLKVSNKSEELTYLIKGARVETIFKRQPLEVDEAKKLLRLASKDTESFEGLRKYLIIALLLTTGLRGIEIHRANVEDIDLIGNTYVLWIQGKGRDGKNENVKLTNDIYKIITKYLNMREQKLLSKEKAPLFVKIMKDKTERRFNLDSIRRMIKQMFVEIGFDSRAYTMHSLRHSFGYLALSNGATLEETKTALRHKNLSTTEIYSHMMERRKSNTNALVSGVLFKKQKKKKEN
jgi:site-specific recombinase XerD